MTIIVPPFMTDPEYVAPCPCGRPPDGDIIIVNGGHLKRWFHEPCMSWLKYELDDEAYKEMDEWRKHRRAKNQEDPEL